MYNTCNIGIQMKRKDLTQTFMVIQIEKTHFGLYGLYKNILALYI